MNPGLKGSKLKRALKDLNARFNKSISKFPVIGEGSYFIASKRDHTVIKYLRPQIYFYDPSGREGLSYLERLKLLLETERSIPTRNKSRLEKIEDEFQKRFKRKPGKYEIILSQDTGLAVKPHGNWTVEEVQFFNKNLAKVVKDELKFMDKLNTALWKKVRSSKVPVVEKKSARFLPDIGLVEEYKFGGPTLYEYWKGAWKPDTRKFNLLKSHVSDILRVTFKAYKKYGVGLDTHSENWTVDNKGRVRYIDFEPNSVEVSPDRVQEHVLDCTAALYLDLGTIVKDRRIMRKLKETFLHHANKYADQSFAKELEGRLDGVDKFLNKRNMG